MEGSPRRIVRCLSLAAAMAGRCWLLPRSVPVRRRRLVRRSIPAPAPAVKTSPGCQSASPATSTWSPADGVITPMELSWGRHCAEPAQAQSKGHAGTSSLTIVGGVRSRPRRRTRSTPSRPASPHMPSTSSGSVSPHPISPGAPACAPGYTNLFYRRGHHAGGRLGRPQLPEGDVQLDVSALLGSMPITTASVTRPRISAPPTRQPKAPARSLHKKKCKKHKKHRSRRVRQEEEVQEEEAPLERELPGP